MQREKSRGVDLSAPATALSIRTTRRFRLRLLATPSDSIVWAGQEVAAYSWRDRVRPHSANAPAVYPDLNPRGCLFAGSVHLTSQLHLAHARPSGFHLGYR